MIRDSLKMHDGRIVMHSHVKLEHIILVAADTQNCELFDGSLTLRQSCGRQKLETIIHKNGFDVLIIPVESSCIL